MIGSTWLMFKTRIPLIDTKPLNRMMMVKVSGVKSISCSNLTEGKKHLQRSFPKQTTSLLLPLESSCGNLHTCPFELNTHPNRVNPTRTKLEFLLGLSRFCQRMPGLAVAAESLTVTPSTIQPVTLPLDARVDPTKYRAGALRCPAKLHLARLISGNTSWLRAVGTSCQHR